MTREYDDPIATLIREGLDEGPQRLIADALPIFVMVSDDRGNVLHFNQRWHDFTGQPKGDLNNWQRYIHPADAADVARTWRAAVARGDRQIHMRYRLLAHETQRYRWMSAQALAVEDDTGAIVRWIGAAVDIDVEERQREMAVKALVHEVQAAHDFQRALLPTTLPAVRGLAMDAEYRVGSQEGLICGDWYDATLLAHGRVLFSIGDVTGHGIAAAVDMSRVRQSIVTAAVTASEPKEILRRVNDVCILQGITATAIVGIADMAAHRVELACAGHPRPIRKTNAGDVCELSLDGALLGALDTLTCETRAFDVAPGDMFIFYTDGLIEFSRNIEQEMQRLIASVRQTNTPLDGFGKILCDTMLGDAVQSDDIAVLTLKVE